MAQESVSAPLRRRIRSRLKAAAFRVLPGHITCKAFDAFVIDYLEDALSQRQRRIFERHTRQCPPCQRFLDRYRVTVDLTHSAGPATSCEILGDPPKDLIQAVLRSRRAG